MKLEAKQMRMLEELGDYYFFIRDTHGLPLATIHRCCRSASGISIYRFIEKP